MHNNSFLIEEQPLGVTFLQLNLPEYLKGMKVLNPLGWLYFSTWTFFFFLGLAVLLHHPQYC